MYLQRLDRSGGPRRLSPILPPRPFCHRRASPRGSLHPLLALPGISPPPPRIIHLLFSVLVIPLLVGPRYHSSCLLLSVSFLRSFAFSSSLSRQLSSFSFSLPLPRPHRVLLTPVKAKQRPRRVEAPVHGGHLAYLSLRIARSSRAKGRISQRDDGGMREASRRWKDRAWKMAEREGWRGQSAREARWGWREAGE